MKTKCILLIVFLFNVIQINYAQVEEWSGGVPHTTTQIKERIMNLPIVNRRSFIAPDSIVDNSEKKYMRPIFSQSHNSCAQASGVGYVFTYEMNWLRDLAANDSNYISNWYPTHFTYNFLNNGDPNRGSYIIDGWEILKENGCPNVVDYGGDMCINNDSTYWMTGYENYQNALHNRIDSMFIIDFREDPEVGLTILKQWLFNHNSDTCQVGGLASFVTNMDACYHSKLVGGTPDSGKFIISNWYHENAKGINHQLTIVGFNDSIRWDINDNQTYSNSDDNNGDGIIDIRDWEIGALKLANSRINYADNGYVYWPYRLLADTALIDSVIYIATVLDYEPELVLKARLNHEDRNSIRFDVDYGIDAIDNTPSPIEGEHYQAFAFKGGDYPILGYQNYDPIEVVLDYNYFFSQADVGKIYLDVWQGVNTDTLGYLSQFSLIDYRWGETFELDSDISNETIEYMFNWYSIDYDLIVPGDSQEISLDHTIYSNMVSRFSPTVTNNSILTIQNGIEIDMYNSELVIEEGCTLVIEDSAVFTAKRGISKIVVNGDIQVGTNVTFTADEGSSIELYLNNQAVNFSSCHFNNCIIKSNVNPLTISQCSFGNSYIKQLTGNLAISSSSFSNSSVLVANPTLGSMPLDNSVSISDCDFITSFDDANSIIEIYGYKNFEITNNTIDNINNSENAYHGISIHYSGSNEPGTIHEISNNEVMCSYSFSNSNISGITIYSSIAEIRTNYVHANSIGIQSLRNSEVTILGNEDAVNETETQRIKNNSLYQIFASRNAFPIQTQWNAIYSSQNTNCFVYHDVDVSTSPPDVDVSNNYWGPVFDATVNLCPIRHYIYEPIWNLVKNQIALSNVQQLFETGINQIADTNYFDAKSTFQQVVTSYPEEELATSALKEILYLEPLADNNFEGLKNWYLTEPAILNHEHLLKLSQNLANKCDEILENYPDAIEWYENIIENPETLEDSIFSIIDLEHLYWQMGIDTNLRSMPYVGRLSQFKPKSFKDFKDHKDELLSLLHGGQSNSSDNEDAEQVFHELKTNGELLQNTPNPFNGITKISFHLLHESDVKLNIHNYNGQLIKTILVGMKPEGTHTTVFDASGLQSGIYFYSISINGYPTDSKKMTIIN